MWEIRNNTSFASEGFVAIDKTGECHWVVIVKGTFGIDENGGTSIAPEQVEPLRVPRYRGDPGTSSLVYEQDSVLAKSRTDIYLNATAFAPKGRPCPEVDVTLKSPAGTKMLTVRGDRVWRTGVLGTPQPSAPQPFVQMPITYERAFGGYDAHDPDKQKHRLCESNPVGTGFVTNSDHRIGCAMPNIARSGDSDDTAPAGFGALCSYWQPRRAYLGTYDDDWVKTQKPLLPVDYDSRALQCAPLDQQTATHLRGGEMFTLTNMHPERAVMSFSLPKRYFGFTTLIGGKRLDHQAKLDTVVIEPERARVIVTWRSILSCHRDIDNIDYTVVVQKPYV